MTEFIQKILLKNTKSLQYIVNEKLANGPVGAKFFRWMRIGQRNYGHHSIGHWLKLLNQVFMFWGFKFNHARPHITKWFFSREKETLITGYSFLFVVAAFLSRVNYIKPLSHDNDGLIHSYDNPNNLDSRFGIKIPDHLTKYRTSAHFLEINKIYKKEMNKFLLDFEDEVVSEYSTSTEREKRMKFCSNPNYVYVPYGWELNEKN